MIFKAVCASFEPFVQWQRKLAQILLLEHVLIPDDELDHAKFIRDGEVYGKVESRILCIEDRVEGTLTDGRLESRAKDGHAHKAK